MRALRLLRRRRTILAVRASTSASASPPPRGSAARRATPRPRSSAARELWQSGRDDAGSTSSPPVSGATSPSFCAGLRHRTRPRRSARAAAVARADLLVRDRRARCAHPGQDGQSLRAPHPEDFSDGSQIAAQAARLETGLPPDADAAGERLRSAPLRHGSRARRPCRSSCVTPAPSRSPSPGLGPSHYALFAGMDAEAEAVAHRASRRAWEPRRSIVARPAAERPARPLPL